MKILFYFPIIFLSFGHFSNLKSQNTFISPLPPPPPPPPTFTIDPVSCKGYSDGAISVANTPGTFLWSTGDTTSSVSGLSAGTYTVSITNHFGFNIYISKTLTNPDTFIVSSAVDSNISCHGNTDGGASVNITGGAPSYQILWSNGDSTSTITGLSATTYSVTVSDSLGCTRIENLTITQPPTLLGTIQIDSNVTCNGLYNGGISVSVGGGTPPYSYSWTDALGSTPSGPPVPGGITPYNFPGNMQLDTNFLSGLPTGTYYVTVTDANGCSSTDSAIVTEPMVLSVITTLDSNVTCHGFINGGASVTASGGTTAYSYEWNNSDTTTSITGIAAGNYTVTVTDGNGCTASNSINISTPNPITTSITIDAPIICFGDSNGALTVYATGGSGSFSYAWNTIFNPTIIDTTTSINNLISNAYLVTITDGNGCTETDSMYLPDPDLLTSTILIDSNVTCSGSSDGGLTTNAVGGTGVLTYLWNTGDTTASITGLAAGTYSMTVTDIMGCTYESDKDLIAPNPVVVHLGNDTSICYASSLTLDAGFGFVSSEWNDNSMNQTLTVNSTLVGYTDYSVTVSDSNGCMGADTIKVNVFPNILVSISGENDLCAYEIDTLIASSGFTSYVWNTNDTSNQIIIDANSLTSGNHNYSVTATDTNGCMSSKIVTIQIFDPVVVNLGSDTSILWYTGITYTLDAGSGFNSYLWSDLSTTTPTYSVTLSNMGTIHVSVTDQNGCLGSDTVVVDFILSTPKIETTSARIYPNPASDFIYLEIKELHSNNVQFNILDPAGKNVYPNTILVNGSTTSSIDISHLPQGLYFIQIQMDNQRIIKPIIIQ